MGETIAEALEIIEVRGRDAIMRQALRQRTPRTQCRRMPRSCDRSSAITRCSGHSTSTSMQVLVECPEPVPVEAQLEGATEVLIIRHPRGLYTESLNTLFQLAYTMWMPAGSCA